LDAFAAIGDDQRRAAQTSPRELAQESGPETLGPQWSYFYAQHLAATVAVDADDDGHRDDASVLADFHSISRSAAKELIAHRTSASAAFSARTFGFIIPSVIDGSSD
jgi:hypothetical protein